ncbi:Aste57867_22143 [Aphanomyces stellatus]|uniref:Nuclear pore complex protein Nup85 n=1 Tax=Aphanomyces stellatus TaxID=120398 RepID=A0A485LK84_9STRA|nr:hypothetical protein As57867_022074 [Aphanomyces stellatus]VFT98811.1 Aste57867_22143 [Aphanomyces stellatus]
MMGWPTAQVPDVEMHTDDGASPPPLDKSVKNLVSESARIFEGLTRVSTPASVNAACGAYSAALLKCVREMETDEPLVEVIKASMALFHLCEILFFSDESTLLPYAFGGWMREHYGALEVEELDAAFFHLQNEVSPDADASYWPTIIQLVLSGNGRKAWELLARTVPLHGRHSQTLETLRHLLLHMPSTTSDASFNWAAWQDASLQLLQSSDALVHSDPHIRLLLELLCGQHLDQHARSWHQLVTAKCLLDDPKAHLSAATMGHRIVQRVEAAFPTALPPFEQIVVQLLQYDLGAALDRIHNLGAGSFPWFLAHLTDLLVRRRELQPTSEAFMLDYVQSTLLPHSLWPLATLYLEQCPTNGGPVVLSMLRRATATCDSDFKAHKLLDTCATYGLTQTAAALASARGAAWAAKHKPAVALTWYLRARDISALNALCDDIIARDTNQLDAAADVLAHATDLSPTIAFLVKYHEVTLVLADLAHLESTSTSARHPKWPLVQREAAARLSALVMHCHVPRALWSTVLAALLPLLVDGAADRPVFQAAELYGLLDAIQDHRLARCGLQDDDADEDAKKELVARVQQAIAVTLSQVLVMDTV